MFAVLCLRSDGRVARQWSAKPSTPVRIRFRPQYLLCKKPPLGQKTVNYQLIKPDAFLNYPVKQKVINKKLTNPIVF